MSAAAASPIAIASPASVGSPCPMLAPAPASVEPAPAAPSGIVTQKEWVIPPRPKPGRKPATDTPPTKRKAQNRAAQRAFRERRAARVNELEDKLKEVQAETSIREQGYKDQIANLNCNNLELLKENEQYKMKLESTQRELDAVLERLKNDQTPSTTNFMTQMASPAPSAGNDTPCGTDCTCNDVVDKALCDRPTAPSVPLRRSARNRKDEVSTPEPLGCGSCSKGGECACYNEATAAMESHFAAAQKRPTSPPHEAVNKRTRINIVEEELETDFTNAYMTRNQSLAPSIAQVPDPCGFCSDGTPCICAEAANAMDMASSDVEPDVEENVKLAPILGTPRSSSPPAGTYRNNAKPEKPMPLHPSSMKVAAVPLPRRSGCRPGGCEQCRNDPMATLFCQSVSTRLGSKQGGCCGGKGAKGGCCQDIEGGTKKNSKENVPTDKTYIPCSAVYQTLSRHRNFGSMTDLGSLVRPLVIKGKEGSCPEVEISSVRDVLKQLDRRFGSDAA